MTASGVGGRSRPFVTFGTFSPSHGCSPQHTAVVPAEQRDWMCRAAGPTPRPEEEESPALAGPQRGVLGSPVVALLGQQPTPGRGMVARTTRRGAAACLPAYAQERTEPSEEKEEENAQTCGLLYDSELKHGWRGDVSACSRSLGKRAQ